MHVLATAGHVDHGKSTLVRALTGMEPDRWAEERRRGMTIDLGYAWTDLPSGATVAFVDVPGHQRFIANMLTGLGPVPAVLFVVAADGGWSRQSEEHLQAVDALQVRHGLLAVTRSDLADPGPARAEALERIARSSLGVVDPVVVSGATGAGIDELRAALDRLVATVPAPDPRADVRLWIDRSFVVRGSGTVVTATLSAGRVAVGDRLDLRGSPVIVRRIESLGTAHDAITGPARVGLNLRGVAHEDVARGDVLLAPGRWHRTDSLDVRLSTTDDLPAELMLHVGTAGVAARVRPLGPGLARLTLAEAVPVRAADRAVLRDPGGQSVAGGVLVLDADPPPLGRRGAARERAEQLATLSAPSAAVEVARRGQVERAHLQRLGIALDDLAGVHPSGAWLLSPARHRAAVSAAPDAVRAWADAHPLQPGIPLAALRRRLDLPDDPAVLADVLAAAGLSTLDGAVHPARPATSLGPAEAGVASVEQRLAAAPFAAPERDDLAALRLGPRELAAAERAGRLVRIGADIVLLPSAPALAVERLRALPSPFTASQARRTLDTTRRVAIPLLEFLDARGLTERVDGTSRRVR